MGAQGPEEEGRAAAGAGGEAARALAEARQAFRVAAEKAAVAARAISHEVRSGAGEAVEELAAAARAANERVRELSAEVMASARARGDVPPGAGAPGPAGGGAPASGSPPDHESGGPPPPRAAVLEPNLAAALAYVGWAMTGLLFYFLYEPADRFVRFHAMQSILLTAALAVVGVAVLAVPLIGGVLFSMAAVGFVLVWLLAIWKALKHEEYPLPFIGELARAQVERAR